MNRDLKKPSPGTEFRRFSLSNVCAQSAEQVGLATAPILAVYLFAATPSETALLQMVQSAPFLLLAIPAGIWADRLPRRSVLIVSEMLRASCFAMIILLLFGGILNMTNLAIFSFIGAAGTVAYNVTLPGTTPLLVERSALAIANSRLELARSIAFTAGPSIAGLVYATVGGVPAYAVALILSLSATALVSSIPLHKPNSVRRNLMFELREGFSFTFKNRHLRPVLFTAVAFNTAWFVLQASFVPYAATHLDMNAAAVGAAMAVYGAGMICGAFFTPKLVEALPFGSLLILGPIGGLLGAAVMTTTIWVTATPLVWVSFFLFGAGPVIWAASTATLRQAVTPQELIGRVSAVITTFTFGARPAGALIAAVVAQRYGPAICIAVALVGFIVQFMIILQSEVRHLIEAPFVEVER